MANDLSELAADSVAAAIAPPMTYGGAAAAVGGGLTSTDIAAWGGLAVAVVGLLIQWTYKVREDRRRRELHELRKKALQERDDGE